ncbi:DUF1269 domain-containing protein [Salinisphaera aquimarina]|uniref:DUF1269 domain-containing protein n=1 Tax=Salinisphaera aquimarina TaxID=2094031 RepID=A0ABV7END2_9GAMM
MRKLYCLLPDEHALRAVIGELHTAGVDTGRIGIVAHRNIRFDEHLSAEELGQIRHSDLLPSLEKGAAAGGVTGLCAGLVALVFPPAGFALGGTALIGTTVAGAGFGAWMASMVGISLPHQDIEAFSQAIEDGALLLLIDIETERQDEIAAHIRRHHPNVRINYSSRWLSGAA